MKKNREKEKRKKRETYLLSLEYVDKCLKLMQKQRCQWNIRIGPPSFCPAKSCYEMRTYFEYELWFVCLHSSLQKSLSFSLRSTTFWYWSIHGISRFAFLFWYCITLDFFLAEYVALLYISRNGHSFVLLISLLMAHSCNLDSDFHQVYFHYSSIMY